MIHPHTHVGSVQALWRYPVKSMRGEAVEEALLDERGLLGDRAYALRECATGHIASAKHPRKWAGLLRCRAAFAIAPQPGQPLPAVLITLPDGQVISSTQPEVHERLSALLGHEVELILDPPPHPTREADRSPLDSLAVETIREEPLALGAPPGTFFDHAVVHLLTTATLDRLQAAYPEGHFAVERFRPNIVVATAAELQGFAENDWLAARLLLGESVELAPTDPTPRCVVTTLAQGTLGRDLGILRTLGQQPAVVSVTAVPGLLMPAVAGIYADVRRGGILRPGATVRLLKE